MKHLTIATVVAVSFFVAAQTNAAVIGQTADDESAKFLNGDDTVVSVYDFNQGTVTPHNPAITVNSSFYQFENAWLYSNSAGVWEHSIGKTNGKKLFGSDFRAVEQSLQFFVISDDGVLNDASDGSFLYSLKTHTAWPFTPQVGEVSSASFIGSGTVRKLVMVAKNSQGRNRLWVSTDRSMAHLADFPLPEGARSCTEVALNGNATLALVGCRFTDPTTHKAKYGYAVLDVSRSTPRLVRKSLTGRQVGQAAWLNSNEVEMLELDSDGFGYLVERVFKKGEFQSARTIGQPFSFMVDETTVVATPVDVQRFSSRELLYTMLYATTSGGFGSYIGRYDRDLNFDEIIIGPGGFFFQADS